MWFKVDDDFYDHPKVAALTLSARGLWVTCGSYCGRHLTDGHISRKQIRALAGKSARQVSELIDSGLWHRCTVHDVECIVFHDWHTMQPSREEEQQRRADAAERKRRSRQKQRSAGQESTTSDDAPGNSRGTHGELMGNSWGTHPGDHGEFHGELTGNSANEQKPTDQHQPETVTRDLRARPRDPRVDPTRPDKEKNPPTPKAAAETYLPREPANPQQQHDTFADGTPIPDEPDHDDRTAPGTHLELVYDDVPTHIETSAHPTRTRPTSSAATLVRLTIGGGIPRDVQQQLAEQVTRLSNDRNVDRIDIEAGLAEWAHRPKAGPRLLPHLVADAARARTNPAPEPKSKMRTLAELAHQERQLETQHHRQELMP